MKKLLVIGITAMLFTSCSTIFKGTYKPVTFYSNLDQPVTLVIDGQRIKNRALPHTHYFKGSFRPSIVRAESEGYVPTTITVKKRLNVVAVLNIFNVFGWAIDACTGAMMKPEYRYYDIIFVEK